MSRTEYRRENGRLIVARYFDRIELEPDIEGHYNPETGAWEVSVPDWSSAACGPMPDSLREELDRHGRWVRLAVTVEGGDVTRGPIDERQHDGDGEELEAARK